MKKIIHLTDLHIGFDECEGRMNLVVNHLIELKTPCENYCIIITGDIVESPTVENFQKAAYFVQKLRHAGFSVLLCPGNHDYAHGGGFAYNPKATSDQFFSKYLRNGATVTYPLVEHYEGITFIGLNSMEEEVHWPGETIFSNGELGEAQLLALDAALASVPVDAQGNRNHTVVYLHHHPTDSALLGTCSLKDGEEFIRVLAKHKVDVLLFGHDHVPAVLHGFRGLNIPRIYDGGTTTKKGHSLVTPKIDYRITVMDLTKDPRWDYELRIY